MLSRIVLILVVTLVAGCTSSTPPEPASKPPEAAPAGGADRPADPQPAGSGNDRGLVHVTFHIPGMNQKLNIL